MVYREKGGAEGGANGGTGRRESARERWWEGKARESLSKRVKSERKLKRGCEEEGKGNRRRRRRSRRRRGEEEG